MEISIGRKLKKEEIVHHIDLNKRNNQIDNLFLFPSHVVIGDDENEPNKS